MLGLPSPSSFNTPSCGFVCRLTFVMANPRLLGDQRVHSVPHALSANLSKRARAYSVADQGWPRQLPTRPSKPRWPLLKPVATGSVSNLDRLEGIDRDLPTLSLTGAPGQPMEKGRNFLGAMAQDDLPNFNARRRKLSARTISGCSNSCRGSLGTRKNQDRSWW